MTDMIDEGEPLELSLATTGSADELWSRSQYLSELVELAGDYMNESGQLWKQTTDPVARDRIWANYEAVAREYRVLTSWRDVFYAAFVFATDGAECAALDDPSSS